MTIARARARAIASDKYCWCDYLLVTRASFPRVSRRSKRTLLIAPHMDGPTQLMGVSERVSEWMSEWVSEWMSGWVSERGSEWVSKWVSDVLFLDNDKLCLGVRI